MLVLLRHITVQRSGNKAVREEQRDVETVSIGRATDSVVYLPELTVALHHAAIRWSGGRWWIEAVDGDDVRVAGHVTAGRSLAVGDVVRIGHHELRLLSTDGTEDFVLEIEPVAVSADSRAGLDSRTRLGIERGLLSRRPLSWAACGVVLVAVLLFPLAAAWQHHPDDGPTGTGQAPTWQRTANSLWLSGPVSPWHSHIGDQCTVCHSTAFTAVADTACTHCHADTGRHVAVAVDANAHQGVACAGCHPEHIEGNRPRSAGDSLCTDCHRDLSESLPAVRLQDVSDFAHGHPQFRVTLPTVGQADRRTLPEGARANAESLGAGPAPLHFSHAAHLAKNLRGVGGPTTLGCTDCHGVQADGAGMAGVVFQEHCKSCHPLAFDADHPQRTVSHTTAALVLREVFEFYAAQAFVGHTVQQPVKQPVQQPVDSHRRRPGRESTRPVDEESRRWVEARVARTAQRLLGQTGVCVQCHRVNRSGDAVAVEPVAHLGGIRPATRWLPKARFAHRPHRAAPCSTCHAAQAADSSDAVILPGIDVCKDCHSGPGAGLGSVASPCVLCHRFHRDDLSTMPGSHHDAASEAAVSVPAGNHRP